ncbi:MAG: restriction endonuclease [Planctomycetes bacterium]|nr:restriction endonuclease [Planctomycetota bacterium]
MDGSEQERIALLEKHSSRLAQLEANRSLIARQKKKYLRIDSQAYDAIFDTRLLSTASIWYPDVEREMLDYFRSNPPAMREMAPRKFEELIGAIFRNQGFSVELTPTTRDGGFDVVAVRRDNFTGDHHYLIECKRYAEKTKVGVDIVRSLYGVLSDENATKGVIVTTSYFTGPARAFAEDNRKRLSLNDYDALVTWLDHLNVRNTDID